LAEGAPNDPTREPTPVIGQRLAKAILGACLSQRRYPSFVFAGPAGVGKRTLALTFAQAANCLNRAPAGRSDEDVLFAARTQPRSAESQVSVWPCGECSECRHIANLTHPDVKLVMPLKPESESEDETRRSRDSQRAVDETMRRASEYALRQPRPVTETKWQISVQVVHWLRSEMAFAPMRARRRVIIVVDADRMNPVAANAFLKTLEEPQRDTTFVLTTERRHRLLATIRSRCQQVSFGPLTQEEIVSYLAQHGVKESDARIAAEVAEGSLRRALDFLDQPDEFLLPGAVEFFRLSRPGTENCLRLAEQADRLPVEGIIDSLLFLYNQALHVALKLPSCYAIRDQALSRRAQDMSFEMIQRRLEVLLRARREYEYNVNRRLFLFSMLSALAEPPAGS